VVWVDVDACPALGRGDELAVGPAEVDGGRDGGTRPLGGGCEAAGPLDADPEPTPGPSVDGVPLVSAAAATCGPATRTVTTPVAARATAAVPAVATSTRRMPRSRRRGAQTRLAGPVRSPMLLGIGPAPPDFKPEDLSRRAGAAATLTGTQARAEI